MNKDELKAKYNRISNDPRQAQEFVNELIDEVAALEEKPAGTKLYKHNISTGQGGLTIISSSNELITDTRKISKVLSEMIGEKSDFINPYVAGTNNIFSYFMFVYEYVAETGMTYVLYRPTKNLDGSITKGDAISIFSDTVTEL